MLHKKLWQLVAENSTLGSVIINVHMTLVHLHVSLLPTLISFILWCMMLISLPLGWQVSEVRGGVREGVGEGISIPKVMLEAPAISSVTAVHRMVCYSCFFFFKYNFIDHCKLSF